jgi:hypothetical protein
VVVSRKSVVEVAPLVTADGSLVVVISVSVNEVKGTEGDESVLVNGVVGGVVSASLDVVVGMVVVEVEAKKSNEKIVNY